MKTLPVNKIDNCFKLIQESDIVCILCEGSHGNNTLCQANDSRMEDSNNAA